MLNLTSTLIVPITDWLIVNSCVKKLLNHVILHNRVGHLVNFLCGRMRQPTTARRLLLLLLLLHRPGLHHALPLADPRLAPGRLPNLLRPLSLPLHRPPLPLLPASKSHSTILKSVLNELHKYPIFNITLAIDSLCQHAPSLCLSLCLVLSMMASCWI